MYSYTTVYLLICNIHISYGMRTDNYAYTYIKRISKLKSIESFEVIENMRLRLNFLRQADIGEKINKLEAPSKLGMILRSIRLHECH